ncbi:MAG: phosphoribosylanthranilate isomerase, partial [Proteobacteria bacterium]|nr:phosphoribosylanthranilate isomerase [Pseudomonadota bacterium]
TTRIKICGLKSEPALAAALDAHADFVGLVFFPPSPRNVTVDEGAKLARLARGRARVVALTVDADDAMLAQIVQQVQPDFLQLHGEETVGRVREVRDRHGVPVIKAIKVATAADAKAAFDYREVAALILFDAKPPKHADRPGGHGAVFDWHVLEAIKGQMPFMLSGGLDAANVAEAMRSTGADAVDVSSGVESAPGIKDVGRIRDFIAAVRRGSAADRADSEIKSGAIQ